MAARWSKLLLHTIIDMSEVFYDNSCVNENKNYRNINHAYFEIKENKINRLISTNPYDYLSLSNKKGSFKGTSKKSILYK